MPNKVYSINHLITVRRGKGSGNATRKTLEEIKREAPQAGVVLRSDGNDGGHADVPSGGR